MLFRSIRKREASGLLANLYEFPNVNQKISKREIEGTLKKWNLKAKKLEKAGPHHHIFSHVEWDMIGYKVFVEKTNHEFVWVEKKEILEKYPIPGAFAKFREEM